MRPAGEVVSADLDLSAHTISVSTGCPTVMVPVLSISRVVQVAMRSRTAPPFTITPRLAARESPETIATGAARIRGHGVATTRTATARLAPPIDQAIPRSKQRDCKEAKRIAVR